MYDIPRPCVALSSLDTWGAASLRSWHRCAISLGHRFCSCCACSMTCVLLLLSACTGRVRSCDTVCCASSLSALNSSAKGWHKQPFSLGLGVDCSTGGPHQDSEAAQVQVHNALGFAYFNMDRSELALKNYRRAVELQPGYTTAWNNLGDAYEKVKDWDQVSAVP